MNKTEKKKKDHEKITLKWKHSPRNTKKAEAFTHFPPLLRRKTLPHHYPPSLSSPLSLSLATHTQTREDLGRGDAHCLPEPEEPMEKIRDREEREVSGLLGEG